MEKPVLRFIDSTDLEEAPEKLSSLEALDGIIVPGDSEPRGLRGR